MSPAPAAPATQHADGVSLGGWRVRTWRAPIASAAREAELRAALRITPPAMLFAASGLSLAHARSGTALTFSAAGALAGVGAADPALRVRAAAAWAARPAPGGVDVGTLDGASDWTFSTRYGGDVAGGPAGGVFRAGGAAVDYDALRRTDEPILFFDEVILFEDELDDNGVASYRVRIRVMGGVFFVLARFFLRVDDMLVRVRDTRYFHRFGSDVLVRERTEREAPYDDLRAKLSADVLRTPDALAAAVPLVSSITDNLSLL